MRYLIYALSIVMVLTMWLNSADGRRARERLLTPSADTPRVYADN